MAKEALAKSGSLDDEVAEKGPYIVPVDIRCDFTYEEQRKIVRRIDWHVLPLLIFAYLLKNMDSNIVSNIKIMNKGKPTNALIQLHMSTNDWAWLSTVFTIPFMIFEIPSNLLMRRCTPRIHFVRIILLWSIACGCQAAAKNKAGLLAARAFLGAQVVPFEAGLWPGILTQLVSWYRPDEVAIRMASISMLGNFSSIICALLSYGLAFIDGHAGLSGWQWAFVILMLLGFVLAAALFCLHPDYPDSPQTRRSFLTVEEGKLMTDRLPPSAPRSTDKVFDWPAMKDALKSPVTHCFALMMLFEQTGTLGYNFWLPTIISGFGFTTVDKSQLLNIPPAAVYVITALTMGYLVDRYHRIPRPLYQLGSLVLLIGLFFGLTFISTKNKGGLMALIILSTLPHATFQTMIYPWRSQSVKGATYASFCFAYQNSIGQLAGIFAPQIFRSQYAPRYKIPFIVCIVFLGLTFFISSLTWYLTKESERETRRVARLRRQTGIKDYTITTEEVKI